MTRQQLDHIPACLTDTSPAPTVTHRCPGSKVAAGQAVPQEDAVAEPEGADDDAVMRKRLGALGRDLGGAGTPPPRATEKGLSGTSAALNLGARVMTEFVASVAVGGFIGWQLDRWLGSSPLLLILFIGLGTAAGFWSVYRVATKPRAR